MATLYMVPATSSTPAAQRRIRISFNVGIGHIPGSARAFPSFVTAYRGGQVGENTPCAATMTDADYHPGIDCYVRGYERFDVYQFNFGTTRVYGPQDNPFAADQIILVSEWGATWVPGIRRWTNCSSKPRAPTTTPVPVLTAPAQTDPARPARSIRPAALERMASASTRIRKT
ncbi:DUF1302 family protein [Oleomonas cavernae]|uniref:DUF1302 family protein n=1 Tax=Oleomonas cavernae TaxID=2320859 RepID=A0A418WUQ1_9PROT|nr:DUF1302 family protein [Oleomonas cavernae]RJF96434.1 DUF1302 family protein [Oleomonas cavernae]